VCSRTGLTRGLGWSCHSSRESIEPVLQIANAIHHSGHLSAQVSRERIRPHDRNDRQNKNRADHEQQK
jgi:hypothetical protein